MLVLINGENKLLGRCLLWKLDYPKGRIYADRIYTSRDSDINRFKAYIRNRGWLNYDNNYSDIRLVVLNDSTKLYTTPYLDSFSLNKDSKHGLVAFTKSVSFSSIKHKLSNSQGINFVKKLFGIKQKQQQEFENLMTFENFIYKQKKPNSI
jgi:hypothetical protein